MTKTFIGGLLEGITITGQTIAKFDEGFTCLRPIGGSPYRIDRVILTDCIVTLD